MTWSSAACSPRVRARSCGRLRRCKFQRRLRLARQRKRLRSLVAAPKQARAILNLRKQSKPQLPKRNLPLFANGGGRSRSERLRYCSSLQRTGVSHTLHTPLMSETNAISGIIIVGALLQISSGDLLVTVLAFIAVALASINIFGGFLVTRRMLKMFERSSE